METCKLNDINPEAYFTDILGRMQSYPVNQVQDLLPWNWRPAE
ncbi:transposase domain-containing protein [Kiloniella antarctica]|uniref:Transposase domain-containing protein n=1 Tax=Kiloniella antarctica TaxID=1550907 RepID=A0ABW5BRV8_9PROT